MATRYLDIDDRTEDLTELLEDDDDRAEDFLQKLDLSWIYHEHALEGVVFSSQELTQALDHAAVADAALVPLFIEIRNHREGIDFVRDEAKKKSGKYSMGLIKRLYKILCRDIDSRLPPVYRKDIPLHRTYFHDIAQPIKISYQLNTWAEWMNSNEFRGFHPIKQASTAHWRFMQIFPFSDNSGKLGRLLMNMILLRHGYLPAIIHAIDRQRYYEALKLPEPALRSLLMEAMGNALDNGFKFFNVEVVDTPRAASE